MTENVFVVNGDSSCLCSQVNEHATSALFSFGQHAIGQNHWCKIHLGNGYSSLIETLIKVAIVGAQPENVQEVAFKARALNAYWVKLILLINLIFLCSGFKNLTIWVAHCTVSIH